MEAKYGSENGAACSRSGVMVIAAAPTSHFLAVKTAPEVICPNSMSMTCWVTPSFLATRSMTSTSKPTIVPPSVNWNGLYDRCVHTVRLPGLTSETPPAAVLLDVLAAPELLAHALRASAEAATSATAT